MTPERVVVTGLGTLNAAAGSVADFRRALQDCELDLSDGNFRNIGSGHLESPDLRDWIDGLTRQLGELHRGR